MISNDNYKKKEHFKDPIYACFEKLILKNYFFNLINVVIGMGSIIARN